MARGDRANRKAARAESKRIEEVADVAEPDGANIVVLRGELSSDPVVRELPSGELVTNVEVTTHLEEGRLSVPVVISGDEVVVAEGDSVVVVGRVRRRFFRGGTGVQSRTEVMATTLLKSTHAARVRRAVDAAVKELAAQGLGG